MRLPAGVIVTVFAALCAQADFKVVETVDVVTLVDGTEIAGTIIVEGSRGVILVKDAEEVIIPRKDILKIKKGEPTPNTKGYTTDPVEGQKVVTGEGFRDGGAASAGPASGGNTAGGGTAAAGNPAGPARGGKGGKPAAGGKITPDMVKDMMAKDKRVEAWVKIAGGPDKAAQMLSDPKTRREVEQMARNMGLTLPK
ncbi:MAG: hypothetical protein JW909_06405 [Planctomycetes bacterium]|nr:hypothetical protein [Planctomycetota bacterium]